MEMFGTGSCPPIGTIIITTYQDSTPVLSPFLLPAPTYSSLLVPLLWCGQKATQISGKDCEPSEKGNTM